MYILNWNENRKGGNSSAANHKTRIVWTCHTILSHSHTSISHTVHATFVQTLKYNRPSIVCKQCSYFKFSSLRTGNKNLYAYEWDKLLTKSVHITLLALLLIQVFAFFILYYSDMLMIFSSGKHTLRRIQSESVETRAGRERGLWASGKRNPAIHKQTPITYSWGVYMHMN